MPKYLLRKTESYHLLVEADSKEKAREQGEETPDYDWEQSDGPDIKVGEVGENEGS